MSIYSKDQLVAAVQAMDGERAKRYLMKIVMWQNSQTMHDALAELIVRDRHRGNYKHPHRALIDSGLLDYKEYIIKTAMSELGPFTLSEILLPLNFKDGEFKPVTKQQKVLCGKLLVMAGFEGRSVYRKDLQKTLRCWVSMPIYEGMTLEMRLQQLDYEISRMDTKNLEELI